MNPINGMMLIEMLKELSTEVTTKTLPYLLMLDMSDETLSHMKYGLKRKNSPYTAYWPNHESWLNKARTNVRLKRYLSECRNSGLVDLLDCCPETPDQILNLENQIISIFDTVFEKQYKSDMKSIKNRVIALLMKYGAPQQDLDEVAMLETHFLISRYLVTTAKNNRGRVILSKRQMKQRQNSSIRERPIPENISRSEEAELEFCSCFDLNKKGLSSLDIAKQLLVNDAVLYGADVLGANAGTAEQWRAQIVAAPGNWYFLCDGTRIVGNWSYTYLAPWEEQSVRYGTFGGDAFSLDSVNYPLAAPDREVVIYILNISLNEGYQTAANWNKLWKSFGNRLKQLIQSGVTVKGIYGCLFRDDHKAMFAQMGFQWLCKNAVSGDVYYLNMNQQNLSGFGWIMDAQIDDGTESKLMKQAFTFCQLSHRDILEEQQLMDIAGLIYDTDPYVYPPMFSREQAKKILPMVFAGNEDKMFSLDHIFCAKAGDRIVGIILHKKGPLNWNSEQLIKYAGMLGEKLPDSVKTVEHEYFEEYNATADDTTAILNCCVNSNYRMRNDIRLGTHMMQAFMEQHPERLELYVLQETAAAMRLYLRAGFKTSEDDKCNGFSIDHRDLPCFFMYRPVS